MKFMGLYEDPAPLTAALLSKFTKMSPAQEQVSSTTLTMLHFSHLFLQNCFFIMVTSLMPLLLLPFSKKLSLRKSTI